MIRRKVAAALLVGGSALVVPSVAGAEPQFRVREDSKLDITHIRVAPPTEGRYVCKDRRSVVKRVLTYGKKLECRLEVRPKR